jgi:ABC-type transport system substrate-binding protein
MRHDAIGYLNEFGIPTAGQAKLWFADGNGWKNDEIIKLYQSISTSIDPKVRNPQIIRLQELQIEESPHIYLCQPYKFTAVRKRIQDMYVSFTDFRPGLREIWVDA